MRLCVCLRGRRPLNDREHHGVDLPSFDLCVQQAAWLRGARSRLLRRAQIQRRRVLVELGAGWGIVAGELCERTGGSVIAVDRRPQPKGVEVHERVQWMVGRAEALPLADNSVDLLFAQFTLLWTDLKPAVAQIARVLAPGGVVAVIEPDYGGLMEHPKEIVSQQYWITALQRAGADPYVGRKLPGLLTAEGLEVESRFPDRYEDAEPKRLDLLTELPLNESEVKSVKSIRSNLQSLNEPVVAHLPLWMVLGEKPRD